MSGRESRRRAVRLQQQMPGRTNTGDSSASPRVSSDGDTAEQGAMASRLLLWCAGAVEPRARRSGCPRPGAGARIGARRAAPARARAGARERWHGSLGAPGAGAGLARSGGGDRRARLEAEATSLQQDLRDPGARLHGADARPRCGGRGIGDSAASEPVAARFLHQVAAVRRASRKVTSLLCSLSHSASQAQGRLSRIFSRVTRWTSGTSRKHRGR